MSFTFQPTLQHMSMTSIAIHLWIHDDLMASMSNVQEFYYYQPAVASRVAEKVWRHLALPNALKEQLSVFIRPVGVQIVQWYNHLRHDFSLNHRVNLRELRWTSKGTVDIQGSVLVLAKDQKVDVVTRYRLACTYCLTGEIPQLLKETGNTKKKVVDCYTSKQGELVRFWTCYSRNKMNEVRNIIDREADDPAKPISPNQYAFKRAVLNANPAAVEYFFERLNPEEKHAALGLYPEQMLKKYYFYWPERKNILGRFLAEIVCFSLSRMNRNQQERLLSSYGNGVRECLLFWPYTEIVVKSADRLLEFIRDDDFQAFLRRIIDELEFCKNYKPLYNHNNNKNNYYYCAGGGAVYREVLRECWRSSPRRCRKYVKHFIVKLVSKLFALEEKEICRMMLNDVDAAEDKGKLMCGDVNVYQQIITFRSWDFLNFLLEECAPSEQQIDNVKKLVTQSHSLTHREEFLQILDTYLDRYEKGSRNTFSDYSRK